MAELPTVSRDELRRQREAAKGGTSEHTPTLRKASLVTAIAQDAQRARVLGGDPFASGVGAAVSYDDRSGITNFLRQRSTAPIDRNDETDLAITESIEQQQIQFAKERDEITFGEQFDAALELYTATSAINHMIVDAQNGYEPQEGFDYMANRKEIEEGLSWDAIQSIRENAVSPQHAFALRQRELRQAEQEYTIGAKGGARALLATLAGGTVDPAGWVAGLGIGKGLQMVGVGSRALYVAGRPVAAGASIAAEGAVGNVAIDVARDVSGQRVDAMDYTYSAAFGAGFGLGMAPLAFRGMKSEKLHAEMQGIMQNADKQRDAMYARAMDNVGPDASAKDLDAELDRLHRKEAEKVQDIRMAMPEDGDRFMSVQAAEEVYGSAEGRAGANSRVNPDRPAAEQPAPPEAGYGPDDLFRGELQARTQGRMTRGERKKWEAQVRQADYDIARMRESKPELAAGGTKKSRQAIIDERERIEVQVAERESQVAEARAFLEQNAPRQDAQADLDRIRQGQAPEAYPDLYDEILEEVTPTRDAEPTTPRQGEEPEPAPEPAPAREEDLTVTDYDKEIGAENIVATDPIRGKMVSETHARAESWNANNPVDESRLKDLMSRMGKLAPLLASTGQTLLRSKHPVARMITGTLLENTTGASGRRSSAAIDKAMFERVYLGDIEYMPKLYRMYRQQHGGNGIKDAFGKSHTYKQFNEELTRYRTLAQRGQVPTDANQYVKAASDMLDNMYNRVRRDMIDTSAPGHQALPSDSTGYFNRRLRPEVMQNLSNSQMRALRGEYQRQLNELWTDPELAAKVASQIMEHGRIAAAGGVEVPANVYSPAAAPMLRNALESVGRGNLKLTQPEIEAAMHRVKTGGPSFTKKRLELDMLSEIRDPETGSTFALMDLYSIDQQDLALRYARRASGEVALSKYGVMGEEGLDILRDSLTVGRDGQRMSGKELDDSLRAFDQIAAEFLGRPFGTSQWFRAVDNLRLLTASSRLGGMAITQFGEYANAVPELGAARTFDAIKSMPRIINEVRNQKPNTLTDSIELVGGELGTDYKVNFPFQNIDDNFAQGREAMGTFTKLVRSTSNAVPYMNGWNYVQAAQVRGMAEQILHKTMRAVRDETVNGKPRQKGDALTMLEDMGIRKELRDALRADMDKVAKFDSKGRLTEFDILQMSDPAMAREMAQAVNRGAKQIIQGTYIGETGYWAHNDLLKILTQFRSFSIVSMEKQWARQAALKGGIKAFAYLMGAASFAIPLQLARIAAGSIGRDDPDEYITEQIQPMVLGRAVLNYASMTGLLSDALDVGAATLGMFEGLTGIDSGLEMTGVRGISDGDVGAVIPALGYANSTLRAVTSGDPASLLRSLPGGNVPWLVPLVNGINRDDSKEDWDLRNL